MKCSNEFILAYNELFRFLNDHYPPEKTVEFWQLLSDAICGQLVELAKTKGVRGCAEYWNETLSAEGADFTSQLICFDGKERLIMRIKSCPSFKKMDDAGVEPCENYCGHCKVIYQRALQKAGLHFFNSVLKQGNCFIEVRREGQ